MAETNDISALLTQLLSSPGDDNGSRAEGSGKASADTGEDTSGEDIFGSLDPEMLIKIMGIISALNEKNKNTELLAALKPHLKEENRSKLDKAAALLKIMSIIPLLRGGSGGSLF